MLGKEILILGGVPFIDFQGVSFQMRCTWENFEGHWPGKNTYINPNPPKFIVNNTEYAFTYINIASKNSYLEITPAAKEKFSIRLECESLSVGYGDFTFNAGATRGNVTSEDTPFFPMSTQYATFTYHVLPV